MANCQTSPGSAHKPKSIRATGTELRHELRVTLSIFIPPVNKPVMPSEELKARTHDLLVKLESSIRSLPKAEVFDIVAKNTKPGGEPEGTFTKLVLRTPLEAIFNSLNLVIEGIDSKGRTQFKKDFFGKKPSLDFIVRDLELVGEVKYCDFDLQRLATAIGQPTMYISASRAELERFSYGATIFFDRRSQASFTLGDVEKVFQRDLWMKQDIFLIVI